MTAVLTETALSGVPLFHRGKVRDTHRLADRFLRYVDDSFRRIGLP